LSKHYGKVVALDRVSLEIDAGVTAVLGQNGAGKTTLINCALGLTRPSAGDITLFGRAPVQRRSRQRVGVMLQDTELPDLLTGRELITLFASYYPRPLSLDEVIGLTRVGAFLDQRYKKLSGGQKRRVQFALAIVGNPDLVFLDEPTTGLDSEARKALWETVRGFAEDGRSIVLTTHYLEEADALADRVVILKRGEVIVDADAKTLRAELGGSLIRCQTSAGPGAVGRLPGCIQAEHAGRIMNIRTSDPVATLRALFELDESVQDLTVGKPRLEDIFEELNQ
jgi:ABC-2 type transport system ATP-binding protein